MAKFVTRENDNIIIMMILQPVPGSDNESMVLILRVSVIEEKRNLRTNIINFDVPVIIIKGRLIL